MICPICNTDHVTEREAKRIKAYVEGPLVSEHDDGDEDTGPTVHDHPGDAFDSNPYKVNMTRPNCASSERRPIARSAAWWAVAEQVAAPAPLAVDSSPNSEDHKQRLTFRFLRLPTLDRYQIALKLGLMREGDDALPPNTVFLEVFQRAVDARRLADLWDETEKRK